MELLVCFRCQSFLRADHDNGSMGVIKKVLLNQIFIVGSTDLLFQKCKRVQCLDVKERTFFIIQPAVEHLKSVHQPLRVAAKIRLPVAELMIIDACCQSVRIYSLFDNLFQSGFNHTDKFFFL